MALADRKREHARWSNLTPSVKRGVLAQKQAIEDEIGDKLGGTFEIMLKTTDKQVRGLQAKGEIAAHEQENGGFVFALFGGCMAIGERFPSLTQSDLARLMYVGTYTGYSGRLQYDNGRPINRKELERLLNMSRARFSEFFRKLQDEEIVSIEEEYGDIYVNPSVFYRGVLAEVGYSLDDYRHTRMFRSTVRQLYETYGGRAVKQLALIYAVLPFVSFSTNIVCFNPEEVDEDRLQPMDLDRLAALLHYQDTQKLRRALESIKLDGKPVFYLPHNVHDKRKRRIIVNPRIVFAGSAESLAAIKVLFN
ncbi:hypothetical protein SAMN05661091_5384 [Paenibacillus uliginis N3/975]|uniref:Uncharacterized protein n=1 Tax=Paenibacillus uliginis N3/975 TaxID=1313296 RepID=A0A1X7HRW8_9BACL|nr:hypothetical protein [Paenibacillus uliginis]SMF91232.1 hypothetical protein SAMN05661091_5384 [Paenibacillus uliginis N3/975]